MEGTWHSELDPVIRAILLSPPPSAPRGKDCSLEARREEAPTHPVFLWVRAIAWAPHNTPLPDQREPSFTFPAFYSLWTLDRREQLRFMASLGVYRGLISAISPFLKSSTYEFFKVKLIEIDFICILFYFKGFTMPLRITATYVFKNAWNPGLNTCTTPCRSSQIFSFPTLKF